MVSWETSQDRRFSLFFFLFCIHSCFLPFNSSNHHRLPLFVLFLLFCLSIAIFERRRLFFSLSLYLPCSLSLSLSLFFSPSFSVSVFFILCTPSSLCPCISSMTTTDRETQTLCYEHIQRSCLLFTSSKPEKETGHNFSTLKS